MARRKSEGEPPGTPGTPGTPAVVGEMIEYRPGQWVRAPAVVCVERAEPPPAGGAGGFGDFGDEPTRLLVAGAAVTGNAGSADWWRCPYPIEAVLAALAAALRNARGGADAGASE